jgi:hypothetical protein
VKQKLTLVAMLVLAAIFIATPVLAAGSSRSMDVGKQGPRKKQTRISMTGTIKEVNGTGIVLLVQKTNKPFIAYRGERVPVDTDGAACRKWVEGKSVRTGCSEILKLDYKVSIIATVDRVYWTFTARRVQLNQPRYD